MMPAFAAELQKVRIARHLNKKIKELQSLVIVILLHASN